MPFAVGPVGLMVLGAVIGAVTEVSIERLFFAEKSFAKQHPVLFFVAIIAVAKIVLERDKELGPPREYPL